MSETPSARSVVATAARAGRPACPPRPPAGNRFAAEEPAKAKLVELRFFAGLSVNEAAAVLGVLPATAARWWEFSRLWLYAELQGEKILPTE